MSIREDRVDAMVNVANIRAEAQRALQPRLCGLTDVELVQAGDNVHAGAISHVCSLPKDHVGQCSCRLTHCEYRWKGK